MSDVISTWAVFTKPWRTQSGPELADLVAGMGFNAVEFPLRPGYQVDLDALSRSLAGLVATFGERDVRIASVASAPTEAVFGACADCDIPLIRIMAPVDPAGYVATGPILRRQLDDLVPLCEKYGVQVGVQPHIDCYIADSSELATLLRDYDPKHIVGIWDAAHDGMARKHPANALSLLGDRTAMVNFKNACYQPAESADTGGSRWQTVFVPGPDGLASWPAAADYLRQSGYQGPVCLTAEYTDETQLERKVRDDLRYLRGLYEKGAQA